MIYPRMANTRDISTSNARTRAERTEHAAAYDAMREARPKKPPPTRFELRTVSAASIALRADIRYGLLDG